MAPRISCIHVGACGVEGNHDDFIANPRGLKRRVCSRITGTVLCLQKGVVAEWCALTLMGVQRSAIQTHSCF
eukprot:scaffold217558_cov35-Attheya_sp.AAC.1